MVRVESQAENRGDLPTVGLHTCYEDQAMPHLLW